MTEATPEALSAFRPRVLYTAYHVEDLDRAAAFYIEALGMRESMRFGFSSIGDYIQRDGSDGALSHLVRDASFKVHSRGYLSSPGFWTITLRNALSFSSTRRSRSWFELLNFSNLAVVGAFTACDLLLRMLGLSTSNQFVVAER